MIPTVKQRFIHFYFLNEFFHLLAIILFIYFAPFEGFFFNAIFVAGGVVAFSSLHILVVITVCCIRRIFRPAAALYSSKLNYKVPQFRTLKFMSRDQMEIKVQISIPLDETHTPSKVMLVAEPLGLCGPQMFNPVFAKFGDEYTYVTWDYRGFFETSKPPNPRALSIPEHARDAIEVLHAAGFKKADVMIGHSMGTAVTLETALLFPDCVDTLILVNGFHGQVFKTVYQPLARIPFMGDATAALIEFLLDSPNALLLLRDALRPAMHWFLPRYCALFGSAMLVRLAGPNYLLDFFESYLAPLCDSRSNFESYLRMFQEMDSHSVNHLLPQIRQNVLLISGALDFVTPAMQSVQIARRIPHSSHYCDPFSSHASLLESPEWCVAEIAYFLSMHHGGGQQVDAPAEALSSAKGGKAE